MRCLRCGECCRTTNPPVLLDSEPCACAVEVDGVTLCALGCSLEACGGLAAPFEVCPIGLRVLGIDAQDTASIALRLRAAQRVEAFYYQHGENSVLSLIYAFDDILHLVQ